MRLSHHIFYCDIFVRYPLQEFSVLLSINLPVSSLRCRIPRALISRWNLGSPYNWLRQLDKNNHHHHQCGIHRREMNRQFCSRRQWWVPRVSARLVPTYFHSGSSFAIGWSTLLCLLELVCYNAFNFVNAHNSRFYLRSVFRIKATMANIIQ